MFEKKSPSFFHGFRLSRVMNTKKKFHRFKIAHLDDLPEDFAGDDARFGRCHSV